VVPSYLFLVTSTREPGPLGVLEERLNAARRDPG
jgi:hypothetical protein